MSRIYVEFSGLDQIGSSCKAVASKVNAIQADFQRTVRQLDWDVKYESDINRTAKTLSRQLEQYTMTLMNYQKFIDEARNEYIKLDEYGGTRTGKLLSENPYEMIKDAFGAVTVSFASKTKSVISKVEKSYEEKGWAYVAHKYGTCALKVASALVKIYGSAVAIASVAGIPIAICGIFSAGNDILNAFTDGYYLYNHQYDQIGVNNFLKDCLVDGYGYIGELLGYQETGAVIGELVYTGLDVVSLLDGVDEMLKSLGKVNTVVTNTTGYSKVWGWTHFDDVLHAEMEFDFEADYFIRKLLRVAPSSDANIIYEGAKSVYSSLKSAWKLGSDLASIG